MTQQKLFKLANFLFNFHKHCDIDIEGLSPGYVKEKWDYHIGTEVIKYDYILKDHKLVDWKNMWNVEDEEILTIYDYILELNSMPINKITLKFLYNKIKSIIDVNKMSESSYNGLHPNLNNEKNIWLKGKVNQRILKIALINQSLENEQEEI